MATISGPTSTSDVSAGAGVGKGRQIAALIKEFLLCGGQRVLWVSVSNDLRYDARRDLNDLGVDESQIELFPKVWCLGKETVFIGTVLVRFLPRVVKTSSSNVLPAVIACLKDFLAFRRKPLFLKGSWRRHLARKG